MGSDSFWVILLFILYFILSTFFGKKKRAPKQPKKGKPRTPREDVKLPPPMPQPWGTKEEKAPKKGRLSFEIPEIKGAPTGGTVIYRETPPEKPVPQPEQSPQLAAQMETMRIEAEDAAHRLAYEAARQKEEGEIRQQEAAQYAAAEGLAPKKTMRPFLSLTPQTAQEAVVLAEILGKPKAYQQGMGRW